MRLPSLRVLWPTLLLAAGCQPFDPGLPPARIGNLPWGDSAADRVALTARDALERGRTRDALEELEGLLDEVPGHVDARRLRQDILRDRGRRGVLLQEARDAVARDPGDGLARYLLARLESDPKAKLDGFARAAQLAPDSLWPWLGLAHTLRGRDLDRSLAVYARLYEATGQHPLVGIAYAQALREAEQPEAAALVYQALRADRRVPGVGDLGIAQVSITREDRDAAWTALLQALRTRPYDGGVQALLLGWIESGASSEQLEQVLDVLREDGDRMRTFGDGPGAVVLAELLERRGQPHAARAVLEARLAKSPSPALRRSLRRLLLVCGDVAAFVGRLADDVAVDVVDVESNRLRGRWLTLLRGPWIDGDALATPARAEAFLTALRDVGWLVEVELAADLARARWPEAAPTWQALQDEARRELAFEAGMRRLLYRGYQSGDAADLATVLERLRQLSVRVLGRDVVGTPPVFSVPLVGELVDPFQGDLAAHLDRYNRHLVLGRRAGGTAEAILVTRLSLAELPDMQELPLAGRCHEVVGIDRDVRSLGGVFGGDLAGVALLNHFLVDHDAVVDWALGIADRRRVAREDGLALVRDPLPDDPGMDPLDVAWRLSLASPVADQDLATAVLDTIRHHERQHLVDSFFYLPIEDHLWRGVSLLLQFGLSPAAIEGEMERRAELAALAVSPHTEIVLAHIVEFFGEPPLASPHHVGFSRLVVELRDELVALGVPAEAALPCRWHELDMAKVREAARRLLARVP